MKSCWQGGIQPACSGLVRQRFRGYLSEILRQATGYKISRDQEVIRLCAFPKCLIKQCQKPSNRRSYQKIKTHVLEQTCTQTCTLSCH